jgi:hypothetical protein
MELHHTTISKVKVRVLVFNATFNNISAILRLSFFLVEKTGSKTSQFNNDQSRNRLLKQLPVVFENTLLC